MNRPSNKQGTDLLDIVHLLLDASARPIALAQIRSGRCRGRGSIALQVDLWLTRKRENTQ